MNKYKTLAANTLLMSIGTFGSKLLVFLMVRFYTGCLTPAEYGTADLITQTANLLIPLVSLDIADAVFRFGAERRGGKPEAFSVGLCVVTLGSTVMLLVLALLRRIPEVQQYGLLLGSLFAIVYGPGSLDVPLPPMDITTFQLPAFLLALEGLKKAMEHREQRGHGTVKGERVL